MCPTALFDTWWSETRFLENWCQRQPTVSGREPVEVGNGVSTVGAQ